MKEKIIWTFRVIENIQQVPEDYLKHLTGTDGLYERESSLAAAFSGYFAFLTKANWLF